RPAGTRFDPCDNRKWFARRLLSREILGGRTAAFLGVSSQALPGPRRTLTRVDRTRLHANTVFPVALSRSTLAAELSGEAFDQPTADPGVRRGSIPRVSVARGKPLLRAFPRRGFSL